MLTVNYREIQEDPRGVFPHCEACVEEGDERRYLDGLAEARQRSNEDSGNNVKRDSSESLLTHGETSVSVCCRVLCFAERTLVLLGIE